MVERLLRERGIATIELPNIAVIDAICADVDRPVTEIEGIALRYPDAPAAKGDATETRKTFITDRAVHERRYAIDVTKARAELGYVSQHGLEDGLRQTLRQTLRWCLENERWWRALVNQ